MFTIRFFILLLVLSCLNVRAANVIDLESAYLGGGLFQYHLKIHTNAFVPLFTAQSVSLNFTNRTAYEITPPSWQTAISDFGPHGAAWEYSGLVPDGSGINALFQARSSETHFRLGSMRLVISYSLSSAVTGISPPNIDAAYLSRTCLVPCSAAEADGSATNATDGFEFFPDITILQMNVSGGAVTGLTYVWQHDDATMSIQASSNLKTWTSVDRFYGAKGTNTWTSPVPLNGAAGFYRLSLQGLGVVLPPAPTSLNNNPNTSFATGPSRVAGVRCTTTTAGFHIEVPTVPGGLYEIILNDHLGNLLQSLKMIAYGDRESRDFNDAGLPGVVLIKVLRLD